MWRDQLRALAPDFTAAAWDCRGYGDSEDYDGALNFADFAADLASTSHVRIMPADEDWFRRGVALYRARPDKEWSLTDCLSFEVMRELGLQDALTSDQHFVQAGFRALLRE